MKWAVVVMSLAQLKIVEAKCLETRIKHAPDVIISTPKRVSKSFKSVSVVFDLYE